ncbi:MAG: alkaline phosphatase family protein [Candidatus Omnitrophica bacterium]|nr:alkaline phosphatase family protein [Candidatus Omnitrophota bacterium]
MKNSLICLLFVGYIDPGNGFNFLNMFNGLLIILAGLSGVLGIFLKKTYKFLKPHGKLIFFAVLLISGGIIFKGVFMHKPAMQTNNKVIILGIDALSPDIIESMIQQGKLPNFFRLKQQGSFKRLATTNPVQSPVAWAAFATGKNPGKNGLFDFIVRDPETYQLNLSLSKNKNGLPQRVLKTKCFWQFAGEDKIPAVILSCPDTFPPDKIYGRMLSGMGVPDILGTQGTFTFYTSGPLEENVGGKVFQIQKSAVVMMQLIGPRVAGLDGNAQNVQVPFKLEIKDNHTAVADYQNKRIELKCGQWSDWQEVSFSLGLFKKAQGIFKFYLVSIEPELKLYISPIDFDPRKPLFPISYPGNYSQELFQQIGFYHTRGMPADTWALNEGRISEDAFLRQTEEIFNQKKAMLGFELKRFKTGILFCYFESVDTVQHMFWRYSDPEYLLSPNDNKYKSVIEDYYKKMDDLLAGVLEKISRNDTVIVVSDHGFTAFKTAVHINSWLKESGYLSFHQDQFGEQGEYWKDIDWSKTKAYAIGFGGIYINQQGREAKGIVSPGLETEQLKQEIAGKLILWREGADKKKIINKVYTQAEIFWGEYAKESPDLYIGFNPGYRASWQTAIGGAPKKLLEANLKKWSGDHLVDPVYVPGVIFSNKKITVENPTIYSIAPTVLKILGYDLEKINKYDFDGKPLF